MALAYPRITHGYSTVRSKSVHSEDAWAWAGALVPSSLSFEPGPGPALTKAAAAVTQITRVSVGWDIYEKPKREVTSSVAISHRDEG